MKSVIFDNNYQLYNNPYNHYLMTDPKGGFNLPSTMKASRFNALSHTEEEGLILYNSYTGALIDFSKDEKEEVLGLLKNADTWPDTDVKKALEENGFLVGEQVDELKRAQFLHQSMHRTDMLHLILMPTEACNFRCTYCYESFTRGRMTDETIAGVKALVREKARTIHTLHISWFGGELAPGNRSDGGAFQGIPGHREGTWHRLFRRHLHQRIFPQQGCISKTS